MNGIKPELAFKDLVPEEGYALSSYIDLNIVSGGSHIYGFIMWPDERFGPNRPVAIISHGYPGISSNDDIAYALCRTGFIVIRAFPRGAWGSQGKYLVTNYVEDVCSVVKYARSDEFVQKYKADPESIVLIGHSMGGCASINAAKEFEDIKALILIAPFDPYLSQKCKGNEFMVTLMNDGYPLNCDGTESIHKNLIENGEYLTFTREHEKLKNTNIFLIAADRDTLVDYDKALKPFFDAISSHDTDKIRKVNHYDSEHGFMGFRTIITEDICNFLASID